MRPSVPSTLGALLALAVLSPGSTIAQDHDPFAPVYVVSSRATFDTSLHDLATPVARRIDGFGKPLVVSRLQAHDLEDASHRIHDRERRCGGYFSFPTLAAADAFLRQDRSMQAMHAQAAVDYTIDQQDRVEAWMAQVDEPAIRDTILHLSTNWPNRYYQSAHGNDSAEWIHDVWLALGAGRSDVHAELFRNCLACGSQPSVILTIDGTDRPDEIVVLGGHLDSISGAGSGFAMDAPGADDNASGIAVLTEALRIAMADGWHPQRTIKIMGYAAEEVGLRGSRAIAEQHLALGENVVGVLQLDMTNYTTAGTTLDMRIISDYSSIPLREFIGNLFDTYLAPMGHTRGVSACGYACSDHASWTATGYPAAFVAEPVLFPVRHTPSDKMPDIGSDAQVSVPFAQLALAFMAELGKTGLAAPTLPFCPAKPDTGTSALPPRTRASTGTSPLPALLPDKSPPWRLPTERVDRR